MKKTEFWNRVDERTRENQQISLGGLPNSWSGVMKWVGLKFWVVGGTLSLIMVIPLWWFKYQTIVRVVRVMIWR